MNCEKQGGCSYIFMVFFCLLVMFSVAEAGNNRDEIGYFMLDENDVISAVCSHLKNQGWKIIQELHTTEKGIDIIAEDKMTGQRLQIEAKGGTSSRKGSKRYGKPFTQSQVFDRVSKGFFTIGKLRDQKNSEKIYLALPDTKNFRKYIGQIKGSLLKLEVKVFWVDESKKVQEWP